MASICEKLIAAFRKGEVGASVRDVRLRPCSVAQANDLLVRSGFRRQRHPLRAERTATGAPRWRRTLGNATTDPNDREVVPVDHYFHRDGGLVRIFPLGDPKGRLVPTVAPSAIKSVLFVPPTAEAGAVHADASFANEAFRVTDEGAPVPKSASAAYGIVYDPGDRVRSYALARTLFVREVAIPLVVSPVRAGPR